MTTTTTTTTMQRFADNGDGTVTDNQTGLQWEKKVAGSGCPHCVNDTYQWTSTGTAPDGGAFTSFLNTLNGGTTGVGDCVSSPSQPGGSPQTGGFNNHCDWRLPTLAELQTILDCSFGNPCISPIFGPTTGDDYWSSTSFAGAPTSAWVVEFDDGFVFGNSKGLVHFVRAVRGGS